MGIFLRHSYNVKPPRWGSPADVQYAIKVNSEKIYNVDPDSNVLAMPGFWGLPCLDYSGKNNNGTNHGATYKDGSLDFDGVDDYASAPDSSHWDFGDGNFTISGRFKNELAIDGSAADVRRIVSAGMKEMNTHSVWTFGYGANQYWLGRGIDCINFVYYDHLANTWYNASSDATGDILTSKFYTINAVRNGNTIYIYKDGVYVGGGAFSRTIVIDDVLSLGRTLDDGASAELHNGPIDEVYIANAAHSADQIALFHDLPYGLYQPVSRPVYFFQAAVGGVSPTGNLYGPLFGPFSGVI